MALSDDHRLITHESTSDIRVRVANQTYHELAKSLIFASQVPFLRERFVDQRNIHWPREKGERIVAKKKKLAMEMESKVFYIHPRWFPLTAPVSLDRFSNLKMLFGSFHRPPSSSRSSTIFFSV